MTETATLQPLETPRRLIGIDVFRYIVMLLVIADHTRGSMRYQVDAFGLTESVGRFAIPFFFLTSGFFLGRKNPPTLPGIACLAMRLLPAFLFWLIVYLAVLGELGSLRKPHFVMWCLFHGGPAYHLWFLPALGFGAATVLAARPLGWRWMVAACLVLYGAALILGPYRVLAGLAPVPFDHTADYLCGPLFVLAGYWLGMTGRIPSLKTGWTLFAVGVTLQIAECYAILATGSGPFAPHMFVAGTIPLGLGAFILILHIRKFPGSDSLAWLGQAGLGIYCIHCLFLMGFEKILDKDVLSQAWMIVVATIICSTASALALIRIPLLRRVAQ